MISIRYFNGKDYVDSGTRFSEYSGKVPHALISPYRTKITTRAGNKIVTGRGSHDLAESICEYENHPGIALTSGNFVQKAGGVKILLGGEHANARMVNTTFGTCPVFQAEATLAGNRAAIASQTKGAVTIGNGVVLGENVLVLSGVTIGDGAVLGAGSVVSADIPAFSIAAGNPARVLRYRFDERTRGRLQRIRWWDFDYEFMRANMGALMSVDAEEFLAAFGKYASNRYGDDDFFLVLEFAPPDQYTIKGVEAGQRYYGLGEVAEMRAYFDQIKGLPNAEALTVDPYLRRFLPR